MTPGLDAMLARADRLITASTDPEAGERLIERLRAAVDDGVPLPDAMRALLLEMYDREWLLPEGRVVYLRPAMKERLRDRARTLQVPVSAALDRAVRQFLQSKPTETTL